MANRDDPFNDQWEDLVRRLGGTADQAHAPPPGQPEAPDGPRDYTLSPETVDDFQPPVPRPMAAGNPRTILSWVGVLGAAACWILAGLLGWPMPWWLRTLTVLAFLGGGLSLFFLLPKTWAHRDPFDDGDYGNGAKL